MSPVLDHISVVHNDCTLIYQYATSTIQREIKTQALIFMICYHTFSVD